MIRYRLRELMAEKAFRDGSPTTITEVAEKTGIARRVLSSIANKRGYNTVTSNVDRLCRYFDCKVEDVIQYVKDEQVSAIGTEGEKRSKKRK